jgi:hypothetical protein
MKSAHAVLALVFMTTSACASMEASKASKSSVLAATRKLTANDCRPQHRNDVDHVSGCEYSAEFTNGKWIVDVTYVMVDKNGERILLVGGGAMYFFDRSGNFIKTVGDQ